MVATASLVVRTYLRYAVPMILLAAAAFVPLLVLAVRIPVPADVAAAKGTLTTAWALIGLGLVPLLVLVGGVAPAVRGMVTGPLLSQRDALVLGLRSLLGAIVPCLVAVLAIVIGGLALAIPGLVLFVLFSLTGASTARGLRAVLAESVTTVR